MSELSEFLAAAAGCREQLPGLRAALEAVEQSPEASEELRALIRNNLRVMEGSLTRIEATLVALGLRRPGGSTDG
jgi:nanoRNase/pAp phosphatase (c-di-AMP/oligoRNAs hydrolase)